MTDNLNNKQNRIKQYFQSLRTKVLNNKDVLKNQIYNSIKFVATLLISLITVKVITSYLEPSLYGTYKYVLAVHGIFLITSIKGFNKSLGGYVAKNFHGTVQKATAISLKVGSVGVIGLASFGFYSYQYEQAIDQSILFFIAAAAFLPYAVYSRYQAILAGLQRFKDLLIYGLIFKTSLFIATFGVLVFWEKGIVHFGASQLAIGTLFYILMFSYAKKGLTNSNVDPKYLHHSVTLSLIGIGSSIIVPGIQVYLNFALGSAALAYFVVAKNLSSQIVALVKPIMQPLSIKLATKSPIKYNLAILKISPLVIIFGLIFYLILYYAIDILGPLVVDNAYTVSLYYAKILGLQIIITPLFSLLNSNVVFEKRNKTYMVTHYGNQIALLLGYFLFIGPYGTLGIIYSNVGAFAIQVILMMFFLIKDTSELRSNMESK